MSALRKLGRRLRSALCEKCLAECGGARPSSSRRASGSARALPAAKPAAFHATGSDRFTDGVGRIGTVHASYAALKKILGPHRDGPDETVSTEWRLGDAAGGETLFFVYDYKLTSDYDPDLPSPAALRRRPSVEWSIGGPTGDRELADRFFRWLRKKLPKSARITKERGLLR